ncbi:MAG TPA: hypothetical protein VGP33_10680 [Chloroflexota bacterium]|nr:hypothetical protein [Chloroflexota bacterium]
MKDNQMADDVTASATSAQVEPAALDSGAPAGSLGDTEHKATATALAFSNALADVDADDEEVTDSDALGDDDDEDADDDDDDEDDEVVNEIPVLEDEDVETRVTGDESGTVTLRLSTDLRRRLRRRAEREGVTAEELAEELLGAAIRRTAGENLTDVIARLDKLERTVAELGTARPRPETPPVRRPEERPRGDFAGRTPAGSYGERRTTDRPSFGDRGGYAGPRRQDDRPRFGERPPATGFGRSDSRPGDRPRFDAPDRGPARPFDRRNDRYDRDDSRERPPHRWESPRRGE